VQGLITEGAPVARSTGSYSIFDSCARWATLIAVAFVPAISFNLIGGPFSVGDIMLLVAVMFRVGQLATTGIDLVELRKHDIMILIASCIAVGGFLAGIVNNDVFAISLIQTIIATGGTVFVIATYGGGERGIKEMGRAFGMGTMLWALSGAWVTPILGRWTGYSSHPNIYGHTSIMGFAVCLACFDWARSTRTRVFWSIGVVLNVIAMYQSGSRGALLGVGVAGFIYLLVTRRTKLIVMTIAMIWAGLIIIIGGFYDPPDGSAIGRLLGQQENVAGSNQEREEQLDATWDIISDKPVFGDGFTNAILVHIVYLQFWSAGGVLAGFPVMLLGATMLFLPFGRPPRARAWPCGGAGIAVAWLFTNIFFARDQWIFIILLLRMCRWTDEEEDDPMAKEAASDEPESTPDHVLDGGNLTTRVAP
jgi:hypothetical protein